MREMTDRRHLGQQYGSTERLETRRGVWGPGPEGVSPADVLRTLDELRSLDLLTTA